MSHAAGTEVSIAEQRCQDQFDACGNPGFSMCLIVKLCEIAGFGMFQHVLNPQ